MRNYGIQKENFQKRFSQINLTSWASSTSHNPSEIEEDLVFMDKSGTNKINYSILRTELFLHLLWPWSYFFIANSDRGAIRLLSWRVLFYLPFSVSCTLLVYQHFSAILIQFMIIYGALYNKPYDVMMPTVFYVLHKYMVSLKYGTLTDLEYERVMALKNDEKDLNIALKYQVQFQLVSGWLQANPSVIRWDIDRTSETTGGFMHDTEFTVNADQCETWKQFFLSANMNPDKSIKMSSKKTSHANLRKISQATKKDDQIHDNSHHTNIYRELSDFMVASINIRDVCLAMFTHASQKDHNQTRVAWMVNALLLGITLILWIDAIVSAEIYDSLFVVFLIAKTIFNYLYFTIIMNVANAEYFEFSRRSEIAKILGHMIRVTTSGDTDIDVLHRINDIANQLISLTISKYNDNQPSVHDNTPTLQDDNNNNTIQSYNKIQFSIDSEKKIKTDRIENRKSLIVPSTPVNRNNTDSGRYNKNKEWLNLPKAWLRNESKSKETKRLVSVPRALSALSKSTDSAPDKKLYMEEYDHTERFIQKHEYQDKLKFLKIINDNNNDKTNYNKKSIRRRESTLKIPMIRKNNKDLPDVIVPTISLDDISNIGSWHYLREVCVKMGGRHKMRMDLFIGILTILTIVVLLFTVVVVLGILFDSNDVDQNAFLVFIGGMLAICIATLWAGASANYDLKMHRQALVFNALRNESKSIWIYSKVIELETTAKELKKILSVSNIDGDGDDSDEENESAMNRGHLHDISLLIDDAKSMIERLNNSINALNSCNGALEVSDELYPLRVCGFDCTFSLLSSVVTGTLTLVTTILQQLYFSNNG